MYLFLKLDWRNLLLGEEDWGFLPEVLLRSAIMFLVAIACVRLIGKRGIMQGVFELVTIITLGSAAGDPMFYKKVGILPAILVFITIYLMYRIINYLASRSKKIEHLVEGKHLRLVKDNRFLTDQIKKDELNKDEVMSDLRLKGVMHLGQINAVYVEASGELSVFFLEDKDVRYGLPVLPELYETARKEIIKAGMYSCSFCGNTEELKPVKNQHCIVCHHDKWVQAINSPRVK
jgi:uncharacterized membrane protein YcaP (DUF421 family)